MKPSEASKKLERHSKLICHGCMHPSMVGWCESHCQLPEAFKMAISALKKHEQDRWHSVAKEGNPKESGFYLWTSKDGTVREDYYQVRDDTWSKAWQFGYKVVAWKNEPEPYTEGKS